MTVNMKTMAIGIARTAIASGAVCRDRDRVRSSLQKNGKGLDAMIKPMTVTRQTASAVSRPYRGCFV
jgi:hypothetical protein